MKQPIPTCAVNLETLERKYFPSFIAAAVHTGVSKEQISKCFHQDTPFNGWYFCPTDMVESKTERIRYLSNKWIKEGMPIKGPRKPKPKLVPLRIDSHTVIYVKPEKATPEYAEEYRQKLSKNSYKSIKSTNP
jgi:hypothetical protein